MNTPQLPPLPAHPEPRIMTWSDLEERAIREYGEACAIAAIEAQGVPDVGSEVIGCFSAAELTETSDERLKDLIERRLMYARQSLAPAPPAPQSEESVLWKARALQAEAIVAKFMAPQPAVVQQEQTCGEWVERWHGSRTEEGWSILFQSLIPRDKVAYLGTSVSAEAVQAIVSAHNKALSTKQAKPQPLSDEQIEQCRQAGYLHGGLRAEFNFEKAARAIESAACAERDARIAELERQLADARKDAERYRWLRDVAHPDYGPAVAEHQCNDWGKWYYAFPSSTELDATIDNAMQKG